MIRVCTRSPRCNRGAYTLTVEATGFQPFTMDGIILEVDQNARIDLRLKVGETQQAITIKADAAMVNTEDASVGTVVNRRFVENIPLNGRSFQSLVTLTPGVVTVVAGGTGNVNGYSQFSVNGQRASSNAFSLDGASANVGANPGAINAAFAAGSVPALSALGTTQSMVSVDALEEFKVQTSSYAAEYGRQPGGQIMMLTRSGTNQFHGSAFDYLRNDTFDANDWFANRAGRPSRRNVKTILAGPWAGRRDSQSLRWEEQDLLLFLL